MNKIKSLLREEMIIKRKELPQTVKERCSVDINNSLKSLVNQNDARHIHTFLPMGDEINIYPFIEWALSKKITIVSPKACKAGILKNYVLDSLNNLKSGVFNTKYPASGIEYKGVYDMIVVPGLAFDYNNMRLGYGGGYYDRFLAEQNKCLKVGIGYSIQLINDVPIEEHDIQLDKIIV